MDRLFDQLKTEMKRARKERFINSPQLSLGELIQKIKSCELTTPQSDSSEEVHKPVQFDFGTAIPTILDSWRGSYAELALGYELFGYDGDADWGSMRIDTLLEDLESAVGKTYEGWKGGDYTMDLDTPVWVDNPGNSSNTAIVDVVDEGYQLILITQYQEF